MINMLTVEDRTMSYRGARRLFGFPFNSLRVYKASLDNIEIRHLKYIKRRDKISWRRISRKLGDNKKSLVFSGIREGSENYGIEFLDLCEYRARLCSNMSIAVLEAMSEVPKSLKVGLYDPYADNTDLCEHLLKYTPELVVVTKESRIYGAKATEIMWESGAPLMISRYVSSLSKCGLIVAPCLIRNSFAPSSSAVILTSGKPCVSLGGRVYYNYGFKLPAKLDSLRPEGIESEYFGAALYSVEKLHSLGNIVPLVCTSNGDTQTYISLGRYLCDNFCT